MKQASFATVLFLALSCGAVKCTPSPPLPSQTQAKISEKPGDPLARSVHHQIQVLPFYSVFDNIEFHLEGNRVTLTGQVLRTTLKASAEAAVKDIEGVETVSNQIEVLPFSESDDGLRGDLYRVLFENDILKRYAVETVPSIHIIVKNGNVVLEGSVQSDSDKKLAGTLAASVSNSKSLQNHLVVRQK
jgi:hyperosmotically inducible periplasmic protein